MNQKIGRNDLCPCGSGKKYKNCCQSKETSGLKTSNHKITAKWLNAPKAPNLMERTFGESIAGTGRIFETSKPEHTQAEVEQNEDVKQ